MTSLAPRPSQTIETDVSRALAVEHLSFCYPTGKQVLDDIFLEIRANERVGLVGPNGSGKTTLFLLLCGVLAGEGLISVFGRQVIPGEFRPEVGLVFQNPDDQLFCPTVRDDVAFGPQNLQLATEEIDRRVRDALALAGVSALTERVPHQLSGGEKCMVAIAAVLAMQPQLVLYDEPSANLDLRARRRLIEFLQSARQSMLISSHDLEMVLEVCDRVVLLDGGRIVADGAPAVVLGNRALMEAHGLEKPHSLSPHHRDATGEQA
ncbi:ABC-type cobalt transport system, ATPase component [Rubidibacter lacunae KORDI 51-2]|uniref:ABC-type cobalt transport system, ATPase component n=1 Tax=Rubidibacter lacunae KORDI 51-2 TaxID=582515 RepID=U5D6H2_9CHRO|nr:ABC transporter ATP-binding protein [Rubidibacter lacunae]ERN40253.1 ABC-type cobalt transport system, ATPase component [Rubidibacter lacunae KORDI 51-2]